MQYGAISGSIGELQNNFKTVSYGNTQGLVFD